MKTRADALRQELLAFIPVIATHPRLSEPDRLRLYALCEECLESNHGPSRQLLRMVVDCGLTAHLPTSRVTAIASQLSRWLLPHEVRLLREVLAAPDDCARLAELLLETTINARKD